MLKIENKICVVVFAGDVRELPQKKFFLIALPFRKKGTFLKTFFVRKKVPTAIKLEWGGGG